MEPSNILPLQLRRHPLVKRSFDSGRYLKKLVANGETYAGPGRRGLRTMEVSAACFTSERHGG